MLWLYGYILSTAQQLTAKLQVERDGIYGTVWGHERILIIRQMGVCFVQRWLCLLLCIRYSTCFTFIYPSISLDNYQVSNSATYTFALSRNFDDQLGQTDWMNQPVPSGANATVTFPPQYSHSLVANAQCLDVSVNWAPVASYSCSVNNLTVIVQGAFASTSLVSDVTITLGSVTNPGSALTTSSFMATIGQDVSISSTAAELTFTPGSLSVSLSFSNPIVNTTSSLIVEVVPAHQVPQDGAVTIQFPPSLTWARDLSTSHTLPINVTLSCMGLTSNIINATITCKGLFATQTVTVTSLFSQPLLAGQSFIIAISGIFSPPTTQPADSLTITTRDGALNAIDWGSGHIGGLKPAQLLNYEMKSQLAAGVGVNNFAYGLTFSFTLPDTLGSSDMFLITFPAGTIISYVTTTTNVPKQTDSYNATNSSIMVTQKSTNPDYPASTAVNLVFIRYKAPPSTKPTGPITFTVFSRDYSKMTASATFTALPNNYSLGVTPVSFTVNTATTYTLSFTMADPLLSTGYFLLKIDPQLAQTATQVTSLTSSVVTLGGTSIRSTPSWQWLTEVVNSTTIYTLKVTNFNTSASSVPTQAVTVTLTNLLNPPAVTTLTSFSIQTYYSTADADLVATATLASSIQLLPGSLSLLLTQSTATTTYTFTRITLKIKLQNPVPSQGSIVLELPTQLTLLSVTTASLSQNSSSIATTTLYEVISGRVTFTLQVEVGAGEASVILENMMTQNSTRPTDGFYLTSWDPQGRAIDQGSRQLGLTILTGNSFNSLTLSRSSQQNNQLANYTITYEQIQNYTDITQLTLVADSLLGLDSLSRVYQQLGDQSQQPLLFTRNNQQLNLTLALPNRTVTLTLQQARNPPSLQPLPNALTLSTLTSDRLYVYSTMPVADLVNSLAGRDPVYSFEFNSTVFGEGTKLTLFLQQPLTHQFTVYRAQIEIPVSFGITGLACSGFSGLLCSVQGFTVKVSLTNTSWLPDPAEVVIDNVTAPSLLLSNSSPFFFIVSTYDAANYLVQRDNSTVQFSSSCLLPCRTCSLENSSSCLSCYPTSTRNLFSQPNCYDVCPWGTYQFGYQCFPCDATCLTCLDSASNCTSCDLSGSAPLLFLNMTTASCQSECPLGTYNLSSSCESCPSGCTSCEVGQCLACQPGLYLWEGSCVGVCPPGAFPNITQCSPCSSSCQTCDSMATNCTSCPPFLLFSLGSCLSSCPLASQFVNENNSCQSCDSSCLSCQLIAANCTSCNTSSGLAFLLDNSCLEQCPQLYYPNSEGKCLLCDTLFINCSNCSSPSTCLSCDAGYYILDSHCQAQIPEGYVPIDGQLLPCNSTCLSCEGSVDNCTACAGPLNLLDGLCLDQCPLNSSVAVKNVCEPCSFPCETCVNSTSSCLSCLPTSLLFLESSTCVQGRLCPNGTYPDNATMTCFSCRPECSLCSSLPDNCSQCSPGYFLEGNSCLTLCSDGLVGVLGYCLSCNDPCATCQLNQDNCSSCLSLFYIANSCVESSLCPNRTFPNATSLACEPCLPPCLTCYLLADNCTSCIDGYFLDSSSACVLPSQCPAGTVPGTGESGVQECLPCDSICLGCAQLPSNCTSCNSSLGLFLLGGNCVNGSACPATTYPSAAEGVCVPCSSPCLSCWGESTCTSCLGGYLLLWNGSCATQCPTGTYSITIDSVLQCSNCSSNCLNCSLLSDNCTACPDNSYLYHEQCLNAASCPPSTYPDPIKHECSLCQSPCLDCLNSSLCLACLPSFYFLNSTGECLPPELCPSGTLPINNSLTSQCLPCNSSCLDCSVDIGNCTSCPSGSFLQDYQCVAGAECREGSWPDPTSSLCESCPEVCSRCSNATFCLGCSLPRFFYSNYCYSECPSGTAPSNDSCLPCLSPCLTCSASVELCSSCLQINSTAYFLWNASCVVGSLCPLGTYPNTSAFLCAICPPECSACQLQSLCTACVEGYFLQSVGRCVNQCPVGWLGVQETSGGLCRLCSQPCASCSAVLDNCTSCLQNQTAPLFLSLNTCVEGALCPSATFPSTVSFNCSSCALGCSSCSSNSSFCQSCLPSYYFWLNSCLSTCPNTSIAVSSTWNCTPCQPPCLTCTGTVTSCTSCQLGTFLLQTNNSCSQHCPVDMTGVAATASCEQCLTGCASCAGLVQNCTLCLTGYYLLGNSCLTQCPLTHFKSGTACQLCTNGCLTCTSATTCLSCYPALLLYLSSCLGECPSSAPFNMSSACLSCSQAVPNCLQCQSVSGPSCLSCTTPFLLLGGACLSSCPSGYEASNGSCIKSSSLVQDLTSSLTLGGVFPLPFTITASIVFVACFMSKLQNSNTYTIGIAYALYGLVETSVLAYTLLTYSYDQKVTASASAAGPGTDYSRYLLVALAAIGALNFLGLTLQSYQLAHDEKFRRWMGASCNCVCYGIVVVLSAVTSYKFKLIIFTKLFHFQCLRAQLEHVQKFRLFNLLSFLGVGHEGLVLYVGVLTLMALPSDSSQFLLFLDLVVVNLLCLVLALAASSKSETFFEEESEEGMKINKVVNLYEEYHLEGLSDSHKKAGHLQSRDHMLQEDDEFTLSISERPSDQDQPLHSESAIMGQRNSTIFTQRAAQKDSAQLSSNASAVLPRELPKQQREKFMQAHPIGQELSNKGEIHSQERLSQQEQDRQGAEEGKGAEGAEEGKGTKKGKGAEEAGEFESHHVEAVQGEPFTNIFDVDLQQAEPRAVDDLVLGSGLTAVLVPDSKQEDDHELNQNPTLNPQPFTDLPQPQSKEPAVTAVTKRELKIYRGSKAPEELQIEEIDLALSKKQRELIQLRKSIRKRERSQERRSHRSRSKDKSKAPQSEVLPLGPSGKTSSHHQFPTQQESNLKLLPQHQEQIEQEIILAESNFVSPSMSIAEQKMRQYPMTPSKERIGEDIHVNESVAEDRRGSLVKQETEREAHGEKVAEVELSKIDKPGCILEIDRDYQEEQQGEIEQIQWQPVREDTREEPPPHKNVFEDRKDTSSVSEPPHPPLLKPKAPSKTNKRIQPEPTIFSQTPVSLHLNLRPDEHNQPLVQRQASQREPKGRTGGEDALQDFIEQTQRTNVAANRSHLLKDRSRLSSGTYQALQEVETVRHPSDKDVAEKSVQSRERPPLSRPSTSVKSRIYMAGLQQVTQREDSLSKKSRQADPLNKTTLERKFKQFKSKQLLRQEGEAIDIYPSSFSSNAGRTSEELLPGNDEPQKPTIHSRVQSRVRQDPERSLQSEMGRRSMKSYRSRSIERESIERDGSEVRGGDGSEVRGGDGSSVRPGEGDGSLQEYYRPRSKSKSRSRSREGKRSSDKKQRQLQKIYLQKLQFKP